jgi:hypothetical protein
MDFGLRNAQMNGRSETINVDDGLRKGFGSLLR